MTFKFTCPKCGSDTTIMVLATICAPSELYGKFSKTNLRSKECYLYGVNWETADFICTNENCGHVDESYGNYVTKLEKENKRLRFAWFRSKNYMSKPLDDLPIPEENNEIQS